VLQLSTGYRGRVICGSVQSGRVRSRFYASRLDARFGDYGTDDPLVDPLIYERSVEKTIRQEKEQMRVTSELHIVPDLSGKNQYE
jgi:hypothetical protein